MATMTRVLTHSTVLTPGRNLESKENRKPGRCVKMMNSLQGPVLRIQSFLGFRACNSLDLRSRSDQQDFFSKVNLSISSRKGKASRCVTKAMFERFTLEGINVVVLAQEEARRLGHNFTGTEKILLALIKEETGIAAKVLKSMGINLNDSRIEVEKIVGRGSGTVADIIPFTPRGKRVLELSLEEARELGDTYIRTEHILLGLLREGEGVAARVLENLGVDPSNIRAQVMRMVGENS